MAHSEGRKRRRECIWCGGKPSPKGEHVLSKRIRRECLASGLIEEAVYRPRIIPEGVRWTLVKSHLNEGIGRSWIAPDVCKECNNGWMNRLDTEVFPVVASMTAGHHTPIAADMQRLLAQWCMMTTVGICNAHPLRIQIPEAWRRQFWHRGQYAPSNIPPRSFAWLGRCRGPADARRLCLPGFRQVPGRRDLYRYPEAVFCSLRIDHLVVRVELRGLRTYGSATDFAVPDLGRFDSWLARLWPISGTDPFQPPKVSISGEDFDTVAHWNVSYF